MYVIPKMRINKFEPKPIVTNRQLFAARGQQPATIVSKDTSDCYNQPSIQGASKTKILGLAQEVCNAALAHAKGGENATKELDNPAAQH